MKQKLMLLALATFLLTAVISGGVTMAWFNTKGEAVNNFVAGTVKVDAGEAVVTGSNETWTTEGECIQVEYTVTNSGTKKAFIRASFNGFWLPAFHRNTATVTAKYGTDTIEDSDQAHFSYGDQGNSEAEPMITQLAESNLSAAVTSGTTIDSIDLGNLTDYLFFFADGRDGANWQGATRGFVGDVAIDGIQADESTSGDVPYAGTIYTNDSTLGAWQKIIDDNPGQATGALNEGSRIDGLEADLISAFQQINALDPTPSYEGVSSTSLNGLNTQNGINEIFVINITSGLSFNSQINITGDPGDVFILRWDTDGNPANGYQGQVKPSGGGAIVPLGGLTPANFINVAGDINASGGGNNPPPPYPQGPRYDDGQGDLITGGSDFNGGGFFTGYWLTTGKPTTEDPISGLYYGETSSLSNGIFVGGWYSITTKFSMTSGTSGVYVSPNIETIAAPDIMVKKYVSVDNGGTWHDADEPPGPVLPPGTKPLYKFVVTNTGNVKLTDIKVTDDVYGPIDTPASLDLDPGESVTFYFTPDDIPVPVEVIADNIEITLCDETSKWVKENGYFYYTEMLPPGQTVTICVKVCLLNDDNMGDQFSLYSFFEAVQASHNASQLIWGWSPL